MDTIWKSAADLAVRAIRVESSGLEALERALEGSLRTPFERAVDQIQRRCRNVVVTGVGKSGHIARKIAATLASTGTPAIFVHASEASHGDLGMIHSDDVVVALSWSGETPELNDIVTYTRRFGIFLIGITGGGSSTLARSSDVPLVLPSAAEACPNGLAPTTSSVMQLVIGDALAIALLSARGFTASDFRRFHPGGKLGAQLRQVKDIMCAIDQLPTVAEDALVGDALVKMSQFGLGYALVLGDCNVLRGIVTDGDLRRNMGADLLMKPASAIMSPKPKVFAPDTLAAKALAFLQENRITAAPVVSNGTAIGGVHIIDFAKSGVM